MSAITIRCPHCCGEIEFTVLTEAQQIELPLGPIPLAKKNKLDSQEEISHAQRPATRFDSVRLRSSSFSPTANESNRAESSIASCEEELIESIRKIVDEKEWKEHAPLWRCYLQTCARALADAIDDWRDHDHQRNPVRNPAGWMTEHYKRNRDRIARQTRKRA